ncbi:MAG: hypothetical protein AAFW69_11415, partial [Pseudomonadota bacterium]
MPRRLEIGPTDNTSAERTPRSPLHPIPEGARRSFVPFLAPVPGVAAHEADLTRIAPGRPRAAGEAIEITGTVRDETGRPQPGVMLEVWNANSHGRYTHRDDQTDYAIDPNFRGHGRVMTDAEGTYRFLTVLPGHYIARPDIGRWRPRHIHVSVRGGAARLITQMYFAGDPHNDSEVHLGDEPRRAPPDRDMDMARPPAPDVGPRDVVPGQDG